MPPIKVTVPGVLKLLKGLNPTRPVAQIISAQGYYVSLVNRLLHLLQLYFNRHCTMVLSLGIGVKPILHQFSRKGRNIYAPITDLLVWHALFPNWWNIVVCSSIMNHANMHNLLYPLQNGFRARRSCETQLINLVNDIANNMQSGLQTGEWVPREALFVKLLWPRSCFVM